MSSHAKKGQDMATSKDLVAEVNAALTEYVQDVQTAIDEEAKEAAEATARNLKATSPKRETGRGKGKYAKGWKVKKRKDGMFVSYIVYNANNPGLTHTLEHGHIVRNQFGTYGRAEAVPHIGKAAESGIQDFERGVKEKLR